MAEEPDQHDGPCYREDGSDDHNCRGQSLKDSPEYLWDAHLLGSFDRSCERSSRPFVSKGGRRSLDGGLGAIGGLLLWRAGAP